MFITSKPRNTRYYIIQYNENNFRLLKNKYQLESGWEIVTQFWDKVDNFLSTDDLEYKKLEKERCSLSRSKARIRELALCNNFEYFGTLTLNRLLM